MRIVISSVLLAICLVRCGNTSPQFTVADALPAIHQANSLTLESDWSGSKALGTFQSSAHTQLQLHSFPSSAPLQLSVLNYTSGHTELLTPTTTLTRRQWNTIITRIQSIPLEKKPYQPVDTHTDDYPLVSMTLTGENFIAIFSSTSQDERYLPWQTQINGRTFTISSQEIAEVWQLLQPTLQPEIQQQLIERVMAKR